MVKIYLFFILLFFNGCNQTEPTPKQKHPTFYVPSTYNFHLVFKEKPFFKIKTTYIGIDHNIARYFNQDEIEIIYKNVGKLLSNFNNPVKCASFVQSNNQVYLILTTSTKQCTDGKKIIVANISDNNLKQKMIIGFIKSLKDF